MPRNSIEMENYSTDEFGEYCAVLRNVNVLQPMSGNFDVVICPYTVNFHAPDKSEMFGFAISRIVGLYNLPFDDHVISLIHLDTPFTTRGSSCDVVMIENSMDHEAEVKIGSLKEYFVSIEEMEAALQESAYDMLVKMINVVKHETQSIVTCGKRRSKSGKPFVSGVEVFASPTFGMPNAYYGKLPPTRKRNNFMFPLRNGIAVISNSTGMFIDCDEIEDVIIDCSASMHFKKFGFMMTGLHDDDDLDGIGQQKIVITVDSNYYEPLSTYFDKFFPNVQRRVMLVGETIADIPQFWPKLDNTTVGVSATSTDLAIGVVKIEDEPEEESSRPLLSDSATDARKPIKNTVLKQQQRRTKIVKTPKMFTGIVKKVKCVLPFRAMCNVEIDFAKICFRSEDLLQQFSFEVVSLESCASLPVGSTTTVLVKLNSPYVYDNKQWTIVMCIFNSTDKCQALVGGQRKFNMTFTEGFDRTSGYVYKVLIYLMQRVSREKEIPWYKAKFRSAKSEHAYIPEVQLSTTDNSHKFYSGVLPDTINKGFLLPLSIGFAFISETAGALFDYEKVNNVMVDELAAATTSRFGVVFFSIPSDDEDNEEKLILDIVSGEYATFMKHLKDKIECQSFRTTATVKPLSIEHDVRDCVNKTLNCEGNDHGDLSDTSTANKLKEGKPIEDPDNVTKPSKPSKFSGQSEAGTSTAHTPDNTTEATDSITKVVTDDEKSEMSHQNADKRSTIARAPKIANTQTTSKTTLRKPPHITPTSNINKRAVTTVIQKIVDIEEPSTSFVAEKDVSTVIVEENNDEPSTSFVAEKDVTTVTVEENSEVPSTSSVAKEDVPSGNVKKGSEEPTTPYLVKKAVKPEGASNSYNDSYETDEQIEFLLKKKQEAENVVDKSHERYFTDKELDDGLDGPIDKENFMKLSYEKRDEQLETILQFVNDLKYKEQLEKKTRMLRPDKVRSTKLHLTVMRPFIYKWGKPVKSFAKLDKTRQNKILEMSAANVHIGYHPTDERVTTSTRTYYGTLLMKDGDKAKKVKSSEESRKRRQNK